MSRLCDVLILSIGAVVFTCTTGDRIAGSKGGSETTNGITASIRHSDGSAAADCIVRLRKAGYVSPAELVKKSGGSQSSVDRADVITNKRGGFMIAGIEPGNYSLEVNDAAAASGLGGALLFTCTVDSSDTVNLGTDSLRPFATVNGRIDTTGVDGRRLFAQVRGLERLTKVNSDGSFAFNDLPGGNLDVRIVDAATVSEAYELSGVTCTSGDTIAVTVSVQSRFSAYRQIDTALTNQGLDGIITGFPLLIRLDSATFDFLQAHVDGRDLFFTKTNGSSLPFEIEQWDYAARSAAVWVKIDTLFGNRIDQYFVMHWGGAVAENQSNGAAVFDTAQGFAGVWHLGENPSAGAGAITDQTANGHHGTPSVSMTSENVAVGVIGAGLRFDGTSDYIDAGVLNIDGSYTLSCWVRADNLDTARRFIWKEYSYTLWYDAIGSGIRVEHFTDSLVWRGIYQDNAQMIPIGIDAWYYLAGTYDGDKIRLFINGKPVDSTKTIGVPPNASSKPLSIGGRSGEFVKGIMDEVRIETCARTAAWINLCYRNQRKPTTRQ